MRYAFWQTRNFKKNLDRLKKLNPRKHDAICRQIKVVESYPYSYAPKLKGNTWGDRNVRKIEIGNYRVLYEFLPCGICEKNPLTANECETIEQCEIRVIFGNVWTHEEYNPIGKNKENTPIFLPYEEMSASAAPTLDQEDATNNSSEHNEIGSENPPIT